MFLIKAPIHGGGYIHILDKFANIRHQHIILDILFECEVDEECIEIIRFKKNYIAKN